MRQLLFTLFFALVSMTAPNIAHAMDVATPGDLAMTKSSGNAAPMSYFEALSITGGCGSCAEALIKNSSSVELNPCGEENGCILPAGANSSQPRSNGGPVAH